MRPVRGSGPSSRPSPLSAATKQHGARMQRLYQARGASKRAPPGGEELQRVRPARLLGGCGRHQHRCESPRTSYHGKGLQRVRPAHLRVGCQSGMKLKPKMGALSEVYDTQGEVMAKDIRLKLSDLRTTRQGKPSTPVPASKDVAPWGGAAAGTPGAPLDVLPELDLFLFTLRCYGNRGYELILPNEHSTPLYGVV
jgi:hypothetical protein